MVRLPGPLPPRACANVEQKEERAERRVGSEASADAGGVGAHTVAGKEGITHGASVGAGPLPTRQTAIAWPVLGGKGDRSLHITYRGAGTGQAALGLPAQPPIASAMALGTSGPPGRSNAEACDCKGAPRRRLTSAGSSGLGPRGGLVPRGGGGTPGGGPGPSGGTEGGGGPPVGGRLGKPLVPGGLNLPAIIAAAAAAAATTQGYAAAAAAASPSVAATTLSPCVLYPLKLLQLRFICGVATDARITRI